MSISVHIQRRFWPDSSNDATPLEFPSLAQDEVKKADAELQDAEHFATSQRKVGSQSEKREAEQKLQQAEVDKARTDQHLQMMQGGDVGLQHVVPFMEKLEDNGDAYINLYEWLRFVRRYKCENGAALTNHWMENMTTKANLTVMEKRLYAWREDNTAVVHSESVADRRVTENLQQLTELERKAALVLFKAIDRDGNERLTLKEVPSLTL